MNFLFIKLLLLTQCFAVPLMVPKMFALAQGELTPPVHGQVGYVKHTASALDRVAELRSKPSPAQAPGIQFSFERRTVEVTTKKIKELETDLVIFPPFANEGATTAKFGKVSDRGDLLKMIDSSDIKGLKSQIMDVGNLKIMNIHLDSSGPKSSKQTVAEFLTPMMDSPFFAEVDCVAGDSNIAGNKLNNADKTSKKDVAELIGNALQSRSGGGWNVYMSGKEVVGKYRGGWSLLNSQVFKSETSAKYYRDGTVLACKSVVEINMENSNGLINYVTNHGEGVGVLTPMEDTEKAPLKAFTFRKDNADPGDVFLDHAVLSGSLTKGGHTTKFAVINVGSVQGGGKLKAWKKTPSERAFTRLSELDEDLFEEQMTGVFSITDGSAVDAAAYTTFDSKKKDYIIKLGYKTDMPHEELLNSIEFKFSELVDVDKFVYNTLYGGADVGEEKATIGDYARAYEEIPALKEGATKPLEAPDRTKGAKYLLLLQTLQAQLKKGVLSWVNKWCSPNGEAAKSECTPCYEAISTTFPENIYTDAARDETLVYDQGFKKILKMTAELFTETEGASCYSVLVERFNTPTERFTSAEIAVSPFGGFGRSVAMMMKNEVGFDVANLSPSKIYDRVTALREKEYWIIASEADPFYAVKNQKPKIP